MLSQGAISYRASLDCMLFTELQHSPLSTHWNPEQNHIQCVYIKKKQVNKIKIIYSSLFFSQGEKHPFVFVASLLREKHTCSHRPASITSAPWTPCASWCLTVFSSVPSQDTGCWPPACTLVFTLQELSPGTRNLCRNWIKLAGSKLCSGGNILTSQIVPTWGIVLKAGT